MHRHRQTEETRKRERVRGKRERERERKTSERNYEELDELNASEEVLAAAATHREQKSQYCQKHIHFVKN